MNQGKETIINVNIRANSHWEDGKKMREFTNQEHKVWNQLYTNCARSRADLAHPDFVEGLKLLAIESDNIPDIGDVNEKLYKLTGWKGIFVEGLEDGPSFFKLLSEKKFPIGNFIRKADDLSYTPEPDIYHDLYGHLPLLTDPAYADFCERFGKTALKYVDDKEKFHQFERLFWFGVEFILIKSVDSTQIYGGGILSSSKECDYCLSDTPSVHAFDREIMMNTDFRIDILQKTLFVLESKKQLFDCLEGL
jgi:phenylalanine-4-hydroxylase